jgi:hypothetical protein
VDNKQLIFSFSGSLLNEVGRSKEALLVKWKWHIQEYNQSDTNNIKVLHEENGSYVFGGIISPTSSPETKLLAHHGFQRLPFTYGLVLMV